MTKPQYWILAAVILAILLGVAIKSCSDRKHVVITPTQVIKETVNNNSKIAGKAMDSLLAIIQAETRQKDSLQKIAFKKDIEIQIRNLKISDLVNQSKLAKKYKDDTLQLAICDSLIPQIEGLTQTIDSQRVVNRQLTNSYDSLLSTNSLLISKQEYQLSALKEVFDNVANNAVALEKQNIKLSKKKPWAVGIGVGAVSDIYKLKPGIYIGLHRDIFRF